MPSVPVGVLLKFVLYVKDLLGTAMHLCSSIIRTEVLFTGTLN